MATRRDVLLGALGISAAALIAGCAGEADSEPEATAKVGGDDALRREVAAAERSLIAQYEASLTTAPADVVTLLTAIRDEHVAHLVAVEPGASSTSSASPAAVAGPLRALRSAEREAARARRTATVASRDGELARVLALVAASESGHATALRQAGL